MASKTVRQLRNISGGRLIIPSNKTKTGKRYDFEKDQVKLVDVADVEILLALYSFNVPCCSSANSNKRLYFEEA